LGFSVDKTVLGRRPFSSNSSAWPSASARSDSEPLVGTPCVCPKPTVNRHHREAAFRQLNQLMPARRKKRRKMRDKGEKQELRGEAWGPGRRREAQTRKQQGRARCVCASCQKAVFCRGYIRSGQLRGHVGREVEVPASTILQRRLCLRVIIQP